MSTAATPTPAHGAASAPIPPRDRLLAWKEILAFYPLTILSAAVGLIGPWVLLVVLGVPRLLAVLRVFREPKPFGPLPNYPTWPLWFVGWAFVHTRRAGGLLTLGLLLNALVPITLPWV